MTVGVPQTLQQNNRTATARKPYTIVRIPLTPDFIDLLRSKVELVRYGKGDVICNQGDIAYSFYLDRLGFVKVAEPHPGGELVQAYLGGGGYFGEIGLLGGGRRTATCTALDHKKLCSTCHTLQFDRRFWESVPHQAPKVVYD